MMVGPMGSFELIERVVFRLPTALGLKRISNVQP